MFTGIVQYIATVAAIEDRQDFRTMRLDFEEAFCSNLAVGASVSVDGVCLTVTRLYDGRSADFGIMLPSLKTTTLSDAALGLRLNVERAAKQSDEIGGHPLSGHIDFCGKIIDIRKSENNYAMTIDVPPSWRCYFFRKGYVALNGTSLTISEVNSEKSCFEVWLIPETLRRTTFVDKKVNDLINIEIDRNTQVIVDTVRSTLTQMFHSNGNEKAACIFLE